MTNLPKSKARTVGVSNCTIQHLQQLISDTSVVPAVNQVERHPRLPDLPLVEFCARHLIHITAYSAFGNNNVGVPLLITSPEVRAVADRLSSSSSSSPSSSSSSSSSSATGNAVVTPAQVLVAWSQVGGHSVIPKSVTASRIRENFQEVELDEQAVKELNALSESPRRFNVPTTYREFYDCPLERPEQERTPFSRLCPPFPS